MERTHFLEISFEFSFMEKSFIPYIGYTRRVIPNLCLQKWPCGAQLSIKGFFQDILFMSKENKEVKQRENKNQEHEQRNSGF